MQIEYSSTLSFYIPKEKLPIYVSTVKGDHPEKMFHNHDYTEIAVVTSGSPVHITDHGSCNLSTGDVLLVHPGTIHGYDRTAGFDVLNIIFDGSRIPLPQLDCFELPLFSAIFPEAYSKYLSANPIIHLNQSDLNDVTALIEQLDDEISSNHPGNMFCIITIFMQLLIKFSRICGYSESKQRTRFIIGDAIKYINRHFHETVTLAKLAKISCMSERSFQRHFQQTTGESPMEYLMKTRLRHVQEMLITTDAEITAIAINCGFYDSNYLCKKFKERFNITPRQFRLQNKCDN